MGRVDDGLEQQQVLGREPNPGADNDTIICRAAQPPLHGGTCCSVVLEKDDGGRRLPADERKLSRRETSQVLDLAVTACCHGGTPARRRQRGEGLSGPIRRADRRFALPMPSLQSRTHDAVSHASADHQCTTLCRYVMNAAHADPRRTDLSRSPRARIGTAIALGLAGTAGPAKEPRCFKAIPSVVAMEDHSWPHPRGRFSRIFPRRDARFTRISTGRIDSIPIA